MAERRASRAIWIGALLLIGSSVFPILRLEAGDVVATFDFEKYEDAELAYVVSSLLTAVFAVAVLISFRDLRSVGRARGLLTATLTVFALHLICPKPAVYITGTFADTELDTSAFLSGLVLLGACCVVAGCLLARRVPGSSRARTLTGLGGLWILLAYLVPHVGGEPVVTSLLSQANWSDLPMMTAALLLMLGLGGWAASALHPSRGGPGSRLLGLAMVVAVVAPLSFVITVIAHPKPVDAWALASIVLRTVATYYGFAVLIVTGLVLGAPPAPSARVG